MQKLQFCWVKHPGSPKSSVIRYRRKVKNGGNKEILKRILKKTRKHLNIAQKYIKNGTERRVNQNTLKTTQGLS